MSSDTYPGKPEGVSACRTHGHTDRHLFGRQLQPPPTPHTPAGRGGPSGTEPGQATRDPSQVETLPRSLRDSQQPQEQEPESPDPRGPTPPIPARLRLPHAACTSHRPDTDRLPWPSRCSGRGRHSPPAPSPQPHPRGTWEGCGPAGRRGKGWRAGPGSRRASLVCVDPPVPFSGFP